MWGKADEEKTAVADDLGGEIEISEIHGLLL
jgi:hypothetical protein